MCAYYTTFLTLAAGANANGAGLNERGRTRPGIGVGLSCTTQSERRAVVSTNVPPLVLSSPIPSETEGTMQARASTSASSRLAWRSPLPACSGARCCSGPAGGRGGASGMVAASANKAQLGEVAGQGPSRRDIVGMLATSSLLVGASPAAAIQGSTAGRIPASDGSRARRRAALALGPAEGARAGRLLGFVCGWRLVCLPDTQRQPCNWPGRNGDVSATRTASCVGNQVAASWETAKTRRARAGKGSGRHEISAEVRGAEEKAPPCPGPIQRRRCPPHPHARQHDCTAWRGSACHGVTRAVSPPPPTTLRTDLTFERHRPRHLARCRKQIAPRYRTVRRAAPDLPRRRGGLDISPRLLAPTSQAAIVPRTAQGYRRRPTPTATTTTSVRRGSQAATASAGVRFRGIPLRY
eukprot:365347-Chlamydomonas_euryale.AAC.10